MKTLSIAFCAASLLFLTPSFALVVDVVGSGAEKQSVEIKIADAEFAKTLKRNLELSGAFAVSASGAIKVTGTPAAAVAEGAGKRVSSAANVTDAKSTRMAARKLADAMCAAFTRNAQKGFASDRIAFVRRGGKGGNEICVGYPDGGDIRQLTSDGKAALCPRWHGRETLYYIGYLNGSQRVYEINLATSSRKVALDIRGVSSPAAVSPDGTKVALVASFQGNPELYVFEGGKLKRLTHTPNATEGCPSWSPDGREIVYMSDESRRQQLYIVEVATKKTRRITRKGRDNVEPDWGADGRIAYITKRGNGASIAVLNPAEGDESSRIVAEDGAWEHPSWARDGRHVVASSNKVLFIVDTMENGDRPTQMFSASGNWIDPVWER